MDPFLEAAIEEAKKGLASGGIPIGSILVCSRNAQFAGKHLLHRIGIRFRLEQ
jgi:tRNA(Arg) A34 adenosine deaminase TadA